MRASAVTGKPVGEDLREGKPTPLLAIANARAGKEAAALLDRVGAVDLGDDELAALQAVLVDTGARDDTERRVERLVTEAVDGLRTTPLTAEARDALAELAAYVGQRDH